MTNDFLLDRGDFDQDEDQLKNGFITTRPIELKRNAQELYNWVVWGNIQGDPEKRKVDTRDANQIF